MREIFETGETTDPGCVFYTIKASNVGQQVIHTTAGTIRLDDIIGRVMAIDVGKRLCRVPARQPDGTDGSSWIWQCESDGQRDQRLGRAHPVIPRI